MQPVSPDAKNLTGSHSLTGGFTTSRFSQPTPPLLNAGNLGPTKFMFYTASGNTNVTNNSIGNPTGSTGLSGLPGSGPG